MVSIPFQGRNSFAIDLITGEHNLLSFEAAFDLLRSESVSDELRAVAATNIRDLFVDVAYNYSVMDRVKLVFVYEQVAAPGSVTKVQRDSVLSGCVPMAELKTLKTWLSSFLEQNKSMIALEIARNRLIEQVRLTRGSGR